MIKFILKFNHGREEEKSTLRYYNAKISPRIVLLAKAQLGLHASDEFQVTSGGKRLLTISPIEIYVSP